MAISDFYSLLGDSVKSEEFAKKAATLKAAIKSVLWCEEDQIWYAIKINFN
jgi:neutral trehalase